MTKYRWRAGLIVGINQIGQELSTKRPDSHPREELPQSFLKSMEFIGLIREWLLARITGVRREDTVLLFREGID